MKSVRISWKTAEVAVAAIGAMQPTRSSGDAHEELRVAMAPKKFVKLARARKTTRRLSRKDETSAIRKEVFARADGLCEMCKGAEPTDLQHTMGRVKRRQSVGNTLAICRPCHRAATVKTPEVLRLQATRLYVMNHHRESRDLEELADWLSLKAGARASLLGRGDAR